MRVALGVEEAERGALLGGLFIPPKFSPLIRVYYLFPFTPMKSLFLSLLVACSLPALGAAAEPVSLFDGKTFDGWEGDTTKVWRIEDGAFVGGSLKDGLDHNEFLASKKSYKNFDLRLKSKIVGTEGFVNGGVQIRSERVPNNSEMSGYQADVGDATCSGSLYDESRRDKYVAKAQDDVVKKALKPQEWNDYRIRCEGRRIQLWVNGVQTVDYTEEDLAIPQEGRIGLQIHGGAKSQAYYKDIVIEELP